MEFAFALKCPLVEAGTVVDRRDGIITGGMLSFPSCSYLCLNTGNIVYAALVLKEIVNDTVAKPFVRNINILYRMNQPFSSFSSQLEMELIAHNNNNNYPPDPALLSFSFKIIP